jgi:hypothetical protein
LMLSCASAANPTSVKSRSTLGSVFRESDPTIQDRASVLREGLPFGQDLKSGHRAGRETNRNLAAFGGTRAWHLHRRETLPLCRPIPAQQGILTF